MSNALRAVLTVLVLLLAIWAGSRATEAQADGWAPLIHGVYEQKLPHSRHVVLCAYAKNNEGLGISCDWSRTRTAHGY